ncbi:DUF4345 domain-containing protein [Pseudomonas argentinensis]|uniref:Uncharacterized protein n=1 Tax=Phytopseudomonas argentinensis TaxID=289370 RepID=A0A1I3PKG5_9GAMM|nr:DUF4345 domain-containing protein [Pseudomonas argentinensis]KAB0546285.1 DUF4345 domain-containing protein [Pseudomonas argentinensis]SFJ21837.1 protein of unknown function [Pseudomonas argentinensis]
MPVARLFLVVQLLLLAGFGGAYFLWPQEMGAVSGMLLMESSAVTDVRAYYGALSIGLAVFLGLCLWLPELTRPALILLLVLYASLALGRIVGLWLDGGAQQTFNLWAILFEVVSAGLAGWALRRGPAV